MTPLPIPMSDEQRVRCDDVIDELATETATRLDDIFYRRLWEPVAESTRLSREAAQQHRKRTRR